MIKNLFVYIFIYIFIIGCENNIVGPNCSNCQLEISAPNLYMDNNGYYHMQFLNGYVQTFTTLDAYIGSPYEKLAWATEEQYIIEYMGQEYPTYLVNTSSYSDDEGTAHTVLGVWGYFVGDTITVYCGWDDVCGNNHFDYLEVIINE